MTYLIRSPNYREADELFWKALVPCEEDRPQFTTSRQRGVFRWFRSPNVVPFEKWRRPPTPPGERRAA
jgi:hypothetical protein